MKKDLSKVLMPAPPVHQSTGSAEGLSPISELRRLQSLSDGHFRKVSLHHQWVGVLPAASAKGLGECPRAVPAFRRK